MTKNQLLEALSLIQDKSTAIKGNFKFDREYGSAYPCNIVGVSIAYTISSWEATLQFVEEPKEEYTDAISVKPAMALEELTNALTVLDADDPEISAVFEFADHWGTSYKADISGIALNFDRNGVQAIISIKEKAKEASEAAA